MIGCRQKFLAGLIFWSEIRDYVRSMPTGTSPSIRM